MRLLESGYSLEFWSEKTLLDYTRDEDELAAGYGCSVAVEGESDLL